jgi:hypothetical protein
VLLSEHQLYYYTAFCYRFGFHMPELVAQVFFPSLVSLPPSSSVNYRSTRSAIILGTSDHCLRLSKNNIQNLAGHVNNAHVSSSFLPAPPIEHWQANIVPSQFPLPVLAHLFPDQHYSAHNRISNTLS